MATPETPGPDGLAVTTGAAEAGALASLGAGTGAEPLAATTSVGWPPTGRTMILKITPSTASTSTVVAIAPRIRPTERFFGASTGLAGASCGTARLVGGGLARPDATSGYRSSGGGYMPIPRWDRGQPAASL